MPERKIDAIQKTHVKIRDNRGGLNFGKTENSLQFFELADGHNFDLNPSGGFRKRQGTQMFMGNYMYTDQLEDYGYVDTHNMIYKWNAPNGTKKLVVFNSTRGLMIRRYAYFNDPSFVQVWVEVPFYAGS